MTPYLVRAAALTGLVALLAGCQDGKGFLAARSDSAESAGGTVRRVDRDVEAPDAFQLTDEGLWDGRPSLGGVWVAHADVSDPERVIIRNEANEKFVIGALFRRERNNPGPSIQVSSDAAEALGMLAGAPARLNVTALRREEVAETPEPGADAATAPIEPAEEIQALSLDSPAPADGSGTPLSVDDAAPAIGASAAIRSARPAPAAPSRTASNVNAPFVQIGIFSVKTNADNTATALRGAGLVPSIDEQTTQGKSFYRVLVGPAATASEKPALLAKVKELGFNDAYFVSN